VQDVRGTLRPGRVDAHVHLVGDGSPLGLERAGELGPDELDVVIEASLLAQARAGVTTVRDLGDASYAVLPHRDARRPGRPAIVAAGPPITVPDGHCHYLGGAVAPGRTLAQAVAERAERGVDVVKVMASGGLLTPGTDPFAAQFEVDALRELVEAAHGAGLRVLAHAHPLDAADVAVAAGVDVIEHFSCLTEAGFVVPDELLGRMAAAGTPVDPTLGFLPPPPGVSPPPGVAAVMARLGLTFESMMANSRRRATALLEHGIRVVSGHDAGAGPAKQHGNLYLAVETLVAAGWPIDRALASATSVGAEDCGVPAGRLAAGLRADLLVVDGDLAADIEALRRPTTVVVRGLTLTA
jgi:imidazolonepropionase-like amidohydrolase